MTSCSSRAIRVRSSSAARCVRSASARSVRAARTRWARSREPMLSTAIATVANAMVALAAPFKSGTSAVSHSHHGMRVSAHIHHSSGRGWRTPASQKAPSRASSCGGPHGQPPHQAAGTSGVSSSASHPSRQASMGYRAASGSGATTATASARCARLAGSWPTGFRIVAGSSPCRPATPRIWPALTMQSASVASPSAAYAARRSCGERHLHTGAGAGPISTMISPHHARLTWAYAAPPAPRAAGAMPTFRSTISG